MIVLILAVLILRKDSNYSRTDEIDCHVLSISEDTYKGYEVDFPTLPRKDEEINLSIRVDIEQIVDVKDLELKFVAKLTLKIK